MLEMIDVYTRSEAIIDGFLIDITDAAREAGFKVPVAVTTSVWNDYISWNDEDNRKQTFQQESGRLWDIFNILRITCRKNNSSVCLFNVAVIPRDGKSCKPKLIKLKSMIGSGDGGEPVITIMLPSED